MEIPHELIYDDYIDIAQTYVRINIENKSNFYYIGDEYTNQMYIILEQIKNIGTNESNRIVINKFLDNDNIYVDYIFLNLNETLQKFQILKIPNNPASYYQPIFLKDLNKIIHHDCNIIYSGSSHYNNSAYKPSKKKIGKHHEYIIDKDVNTKE